MSTNYYSPSEQDRKKRLALWEQAPKQCPYCETPINTDMPAYGNDKPRQHCGGEKCRKAASRANIAQRKEQARTDARARVLRYCEQHVDQEQKQAIMEMCDALMEYSYDEAHQIAERVVMVVETKRCKHDRISVLEQNAAIWKRKGEESERQLNERIAELEAELALFNNLEATIHGIATRQLHLQPDPEKQTTIPTSEANGEQNEDDDQDEE